jgi:glycosyltransferase involved in cell wall biosynthesis
MHILYLNPFSQALSGPDESLLALLAPLTSNGVEAHVVLPAPGPQVARYQALGAAVHFAPLAIIRRELSARACLFPAAVLRSVAAVRAIARRVGAQIVHTNMEVLLEGGLAARSLRLPHVLHYRGNTLDRPKLVFDGLTAIWSATADHIYCISRATAAVFQRRGRGAKVEALYNPIDVGAFAGAARSDEVRASLGARPGEPLVVTVGRIHPRKDLETFLRAAARVVAARPDARFAVVGVAEVPVEQQYQQRLHDLARELGIASRVVFAGLRRDVPQVMASSDVFVLSARHEGFGRVVAEAMAAARPVVVSDEGAPPELVEADRFGLVARPGDADDFARQITRLLTQPAFAREVGARAGEQARQFDAVPTAARVQACYERLIAQRAGW